MSKLTERLLVVAILAALGFYGWSLTRDTVLLMVRLSNQAQVAEQRIAQCEGALKSAKELK